MEKIIGQNRYQNHIIRKVGFKIKEDKMKCECGFEFSKPGEYRNCNAFVTEKGQSGVICPKCGTRYVYGIKEEPTERV